MGDAACTLALSMLVVYLGTESQLNFVCSTQFICSTQFVCSTRFVCSANTAAQSRQLHQTKLVEPIIWCCRSSSATEYGPLPRSPCRAMPTRDYIHWTGSLRPTTCTLQGGQPLQDDLQRLFGCIHPHPYPVHLSLSTASVSACILRTPSSPCALHSWIHWQL